MAGFTMTQLDEQLVLIRQLYAGKLSQDDFDASMSEMKSQQKVVNDAHQLILDARNIVDIWIGGVFQRRSYAPVKSACEDARDAVKTGNMEDRKRAFNAKWKELDAEIKANTADKRRFLKECETLTAVAVLSESWGGPHINIPEPVSESVPESVVEPTTEIVWRLSGGKFYNATEGIHVDIERFVLIVDDINNYRARAFAEGQDWQMDFVGVNWSYVNGQRWDATITKEQHDLIKEHGRL